MKNDLRQLGKKGTAHKKLPWSKPSSIKRLDDTKHKYHGEYRLLRERQMNNIQTNEARNPYVLGDDSSAESS